MSLPSGSGVATAGSQVAAQEGVLRSAKCDSPHALSDTGKEGPAFLWRAGSSAVVAFGSRYRGRGARLRPWVR